MSDKKIVYTFTVEKEITTKEVEKQNQDNGTVITTEKPVVTKAPVTINFRKPSRRQIESADIFYGAKLNDFLKAGLPSLGQLIKRMEDEGGLVYKDAGDALQKYNAEYFKLLDEIRDLANKANKTQEDKDREAAAKLELKETRDILVQIRSQLSSIYENAAETKAKNRQAMWYILNLAEWDNDKTGDFKEIFTGKDYDERIDNYDLLEDKGEPHFLTAIEKLSSIVWYWLAAPNATKEEIDEFLKESE